jgi:tetratricopeptide (TPR) repeat protein
MAALCSLFMGNVPVNSSPIESASAAELFRLGTVSYASNDFNAAAELFQKSATLKPSVGTLYDLGNAQWQVGQAGPAILAWERAMWLNPFDHRTKNNLRFARKIRQLDAPELAWQESCSTWLPADVWAWISSLSFWLALAMIILPGILRWRRSAWHQGIAAAGFAIFLLTLPALAGVHLRSRMGVLLPQDTVLRLTPTTDGQVIGRLPAGEIARLERERGTYLYIHASTISGWVERPEFGLLARGQ